VTYCDLFVLHQEDFEQVLNDFPEFRETIRREAIKRVVEKMPLLKDMTEPSFVAALVEFLNPTVALPGQKIVKYGDVGNEMYFIAKGTIMATKSRALQ
jgi:hypothetical protein